MRQSYFLPCLFGNKIQNNKRGQISKNRQIDNKYHHFQNSIIIIKTIYQSIMPELKPIPEGTIRCPYMPEHVMHKQSLVTHLNRCKATNKHLFKVCMYNSLHIIPRQLYDEHIQNCQDSNQLDQSYREVVFNNQREESYDEDRDWIGKSWQNGRFQDDSHSSGGDEWLSESSCSENNGYGYYQYCQYDPYYQTARQYRQNQPKPQGIDCNFEEGGHGHKLDPRKYNLTPRNQWQKPYLPYPSRNNKNSQSFGANHQRRGYMNTESEKYCNYHYYDQTQNQNQRRKFSDQNLSKYPEIEHNYPKEKIQPQKLSQQQNQQYQYQQQQQQQRQQQKQWQHQQQQQQQKQQYPNFRKKGEINTQKIQAYNGQSDKDTHEESVLSLSIKNDSKNKNIGNDKNMRIKVNANNKSWNDDDGDDDDNKERILQQQISNVNLNKSMNAGDDAQILFFIHEIDSKMQKIKIKEESFDEFGDTLAEQASFIKNKRNASNLRRMPDELFNQ